MTPVFFSSASNNYSPYASDDQHHDQFLISPNNSQAFSSSNSLTTHMFLNSKVYDDQNGIFNRELQATRPQHEGDNFGSSQAYNDHRIENNEEKGAKFPTWNKSGVTNMNDQTQMKWMSSKMRVMLKMKKSDPVSLKIYSSNTREVTKLEDRKSPTSPMEETDNSSNSTCSNTNIPIRVCSDCNTTKTPLWRSGPCGPKSLCNACGIRQRKARRALAAALAQNGDNNVSINKPIVAQLKVKKTLHKDLKKPSNGLATKLKKRQYTKQIITNTTVITPSPSVSPYPSRSPSPSPSPSPSSSSPARKNHVEEFLVNLSKNLTCYRVFPQDEKEAAILLMALSCGFAHET
ncbi:GATA transcription factor 21-like protein [Tanacetum coccineum]